MIYLILFWEFFKTGLFAVGGGFGLIRTVLRYRKAKKSRELR